MANHDMPMRTFEFSAPIPTRGETPKDLASGYEQVLYRFFDAEGDLLYVGITWNPYRRWQRHANKAAWFGSAVRVTCEVFPNEWTALKAEVAAIHSERPIFNLRSAVA